MKYSKGFERDYQWYLSVSSNFNFDGVANYTNKKGENIIRFSKDGVSAKEAFYIYDSQGKIKPTFEVEELHTLLKTKGSVNLHIKMYAEDRAKGILPRIEFDEWVKDWGAPGWFIDAVEKQKYKYYSPEILALISSR